MSWNRTIPLIHLGLPALSYSTVEDNSGSDQRKQACYFSVPSFFLKANTRTSSNLSASSHNFPKFLAKHSVDSIESSSGSLVKSLPSCFKNPPRIDGHCSRGGRVPLNRGLTIAIMHSWSELPSLPPTRGKGSKWSLPSYNHGFCSIHWAVRMKCKIYALSSLLARRGYNHIGDYDSLMITNRQG